MTRQPIPVSPLLVAAVLAASLPLVACGPATEVAAGDQPTRTSSFGTYTDPESAVWDAWQRTSQYVPAEDGTRLAVDVFLPTRAGATPSEPVPVVLHYTRYIRALELDDGTVRTQVDNDPVLQHLLRHGYAVAVADARGTGASFGVHHGAFSVEETADSYAIIEWLGSQPWSNGRVGMSGRSYPGMTQYQAATLAPPSLKAIFSEMAGPSAYDFIYRGGAFKKDFIDVWGAATRAQDRGEAGSPARVDADEDGSLRAAAVAEHAGNLWAQGLIRPGSNLRNFAFDRPGGGHWSWDRVIATIDDADALAASGIGIYHLVGWYDIYTTQQPWLYATLEGRARQKMMIGPWVHSGGYGGTVHNAEILRWYDYWLKGVDNGVLDEPPVHYFVMRGNHTLPEGATETQPTVDEAAAEEGLCMGVQRGVATSGGAAPLLLRRRQDRLGRLHERRPPRRRSAGRGSRRFVHRGLLLRDGIVLALDERLRRASGEPARLDLLRRAQRRGREGPDLHDRADDGGSQARRLSDRAPDRGLEPRRR